MITDDQIRDLARTRLTPMQHKTCAIALGRRTMLMIVDGRLINHRFTKAERATARARCAETIARAA